MGNNHNERPLYKNHLDKRVQEEVLRRLTANQLFLEEVDNVAAPIILWLVVSSILLVLVLLAVYTFDFVVIPVIGSFVAIVTAWKACSILYQYIKQNHATATLELGLVLFGTTLITLVNLAVVVMIVRGG